MHPVGHRQTLDPDRRAWAVLVGGVLAVCALVPIANANTRSLPFDDAYISFSYAARLVAGHGLRLSVGSAPVEAFSDPLWVALLAVGRLLGVAIPTWARVVNIALVGVIGGTTARLVRRLNPAAPAWMAVGTAALAVAVPAIAYDAVAGLETLLFAALVNLVLLAFLTDWQRKRALGTATTVLCLLLAVTRPEGALVWVVLWGQTWLWSRHWRRQARAAAAFVAPMVVLELARLAYFGQALPNSIVAKEGQSGAVTRQLVRAEANRFATAYLPVLLLAGVVVVVVLAGRRWRSPVTALLPVVLGMGLVEVALSGGDNYPYERYLLPLLAPVAAIAVAGITQLGWDGAPSAPNASSASSALSALSASDRRAERWRVASAVVVIAALLGTFATAYRHEQPGTTTGNALAVGRGLSRIPNLFAQDRLADHGDNYQFSLAGILNRLGQPHQVVATDEVGAVSYYTNLRVLDLYGLADAHIAHRPGPPGTRVDPTYVFAQQPAFFSFRLGGSCLCPGIGDDLAYTNDARLFAYRLVALVPEVIPDYHAVPPAALVQRDPSVTRVVSLDAVVPTADRALGTFPVGVERLITPDLHARTVSRPTAAQVAAAPLALRDTFTVLAPGRDVAVALPARVGAGCQVEVTAFSDGGATRTMSLAVTDPQGRSIAGSALQPSAAPMVRTVAVALPAEGSAAVLHLAVAAGPGTERWAEPRVICRSSPPR